MAFIRRVRTASGATAVQIAEYAGGRQRIVAHVGSAHTEAEPGVLPARARDLLEDPAQGVLDLGIEPTPPVTALSARSGEPALFATPEEAAVAAPPGPARVVGTDSRLLFEALAGVYASLGFDALADGVFRDLVIARVVEPTSLLDSGRVLIDLGQRPAGYATMKPTLARAAGGGYRDQIAQENRAKAVIAGEKAARTPRFVKTSGGKPVLDEASLARARHLVGLKG